MKRLKLLPVKTVLQPTEKISKLKSGSENRIRNQYRMTSDL